MSGYQIAFTGTEPTNPTPENNNSDTGIPTLHVTAVQNLSATSPETQMETKGKSPVSNLTEVKTFMDSVRKKERIILMKSIAICLAGGFTMMAIARLK
jgi:hypothetical protein